MRSRIDGVETPALVTNVDGQGLGLHCGERAVVLPAAIAETEPGRVEAQRGHKEGCRFDDVPLGRNRNLPQPASELHVWTPSPEFQRPLLLNDGRQGSRSAVRQQLPHEIVEVDLAPERPIATNCGKAQLRGLFKYSCVLQRSPSLCLASFTSARAFST